MFIIILLGSIWGFLEASLGGFLHIMNFPLTGQIMAPIGFGLMAIGLKNNLKNHQLIYIALVAASFKFLDSVLFSISISDIRILNPAQAIIMQGVAFALLSRITNRVLILSLLASPVGMVMFNLVSYYLMGYTNTYHLQNITNTLILHVPVGVILTALALKLIAKRLFDLKAFPDAWQLVTSAALILLTIVFRGMLV